MNQEENLTVFKELILDSLDFPVIKLVRAKWLELIVLEPEISDEQKR